MTDNTKQVSTAQSVRQQATKYLQIVNPQLSADEVESFLGIAEAYGLNPFKREIYAGKMWQDGKERLVPMTGYEVYIKRAERTEKLNGWNVEYKATPERVARLTIHRKDWAHPFVHDVYYDETVQKKKDGNPNAFWAKQPRFMLKKVAISQGFRLCFPDELGGMPYTPDEMPAEEPRDVTPSTPKPERPDIEIVLKSAKPETEKNKAKARKKAMEPFEELFTLYHEIVDENDTAQLADQIKGKNGVQRSELLMEWKERLAARKDVLDGQVMDVDTETTEMDFAEST